MKIAYESYFDGILRRKGREAIVDTSSGSKEIVNPNFAGVANFLKTDHSIESLELKNLNFKEGSMKEIWKAIGINKSIESIKISRCAFEQTDWESIADNLLLKKSLEQLIIHYSFEQVKDFNFLYSILGKVGVKHFDFRGAGNGYLYSIGLSEKGVIVIAEALRSTKLVFLKLSDIKIGSKGAERISKALLENKSLRELDLSWNEIDSKGAEYISKALLKNKSLQKLDLSYNKIDFKGGEHISKLLSSGATNPKYIGLGNNKLGYEGLEYIMNALKTNKFLESLGLQRILSNNGIERYMEKEKAIKIAEALKINKSLRYLDLESNKFIDSEIYYIAEALKVNKTLQFLKLSCNRSGDLGVLYLAEAIELNNSLRELHLIHNYNMADKGLLALCKSLEKNYFILKLNCGDIGYESYSKYKNAINFNLERNKEFYTQAYSLDLYHKLIVPELSGVVVQIKEVGVDLFYE